MKSPSVHDIITATEVCGLKSQDTAGEGADSTQSLPILNHFGASDAAAADVPVLV